MRVSSSMLSTFMGCQLQGKFHYVDKLPTRTNASMVYGSCVHAALESYGKGITTAEESVQLFKEYWEDPFLLGLKIEYWIPRTNKGTLRERGIDTVRQYAKRVEREGRKQIAWEHGFKVPIGDHEITGYVDLMEVTGSGKSAVLRINDYKTSVKTPSKESLRYNQQFTIYQWASMQPEFWVGYPGDYEFTGMPNGGEMWDKYKDCKRKCYWWNVTTDKEAYVGERTDQDFKRLYRVIDEVAKAFETNTFVPCISGETCSRCDYVVECGLPIPESNLTGIDLF